MKKELPFLMKKWSSVCSLLFLVTSIFVIIYSGSDDNPFTGTFFCEENKNASFVLLDPPGGFYVKVDNGKNFTVKKNELNMPYGYDLTDNRLIIHALSPVVDAEKLAKMTADWGMGPPKVEKTVDGRLKYSMRHDTPFTISRSEYVMNGNEVVSHYDYENSSFMTLFPMVFAFVLLYYIVKFLIKIYEKST